MLGLCWPRLGLCWPHVGLCWPYVEPSWRLCWAYVGDMLAILGLGYVRQFKQFGGPLPTKCRLSLSARRALPTPPLKNTAFLHFSIFAASRFDMRTVKHSVFYTSHTRSTVNYSDFSDPEVPRFGPEGRRQGDSRKQMRPQPWDPENPVFLTFFFSRLLLTMGQRSPT